MNIFAYNETIIVMTPRTMYSVQCTLYIVYNVCRKEKICILISTHTYTPITFLSLYASDLDMLYEHVLLYSYCYC